MSEYEELKQTTVLNVNEADGWEVKRVNKDRRRFTSIAPIKTMNNGITEPDLLDLLGELSKGARDLYLDIKRGMNFKTHTARLSNKGLTQSQINRRSKAIKELEASGRGLACRVPTRGIENLNQIELRHKPSTFMLSPEYIYPGKRFAGEIHHIWRQCTGGPEPRSKEPGQHNTEKTSEPLDWASSDPESSKQTVPRPTRSLFSR